jgi:hypothetical protein
LITNCSIGNYKYDLYDATKASHQTRGHQQWVDGVNRTGPIWYHAISKVCLEHCVFKQLTFAAREPRRKAKRYSPLFDITHLTPHSKGALKSFESLYIFITLSQSVKLLSRALKVGKVTNLVALVLIFAIPGKLEPDIKRACTIQADMSGLVEELIPMDGPTDQYFVVPYDVVVKGDGTKMEAFLQWNEKVRVWTCDLITSPTDGLCRVSQNAVPQLLCRLSSFQNRRRCEEATKA